MPSRNPIAIANAHLTSVRLIDAHTPNDRTPPATPTRQVWIEALSLTSDDHLYHLLATHISELTRLLQQLRRTDLTRLPHFDQAITRLIRLFFSVPHTQYAIFRDSVSPDFIGTLDLLSDALDLHYSYPILETDQLNDFITQLTNLKRLAVESQLNTDLKQVLIDSLAFLIQQLNSYEETGTHGVRQAIDSAIANTVHLHSHFQSATHNDKATVLQPFLNVLSNIDRAVGIATRLRDLAAPAIELLLSSGKTA